MSLFDLFDDQTKEDIGLFAPPPNGIEWDRTALLALEMEVLGIYVSDHPLSPYEYGLSKVRSFPISDIYESYPIVIDGIATGEMLYKVKEGVDVSVAGLLESFREISTKTGDTMYLGSLEDMQGKVNFVVFPSTVKSKGFKEVVSKVKSHCNIRSGEMFEKVFVCLHGKIDRGDRGDQVIVSQMEVLDLSEKDGPKIMEIHLPLRLVTEHHTLILREMLSRFSGLDTVHLMVENSMGLMVSYELPCKVNASNLALKAEIRDFLEGAGAVLVVDQ